MQWVLRGPCHEREALEALLRCVQPALRRYLSGLVGSTEADDLQQDVLMIVVRRLRSLEEHRNRLTIATVVTAVLLLLGFVHGAQAVHSHDTNLFLHSVMIILGVWTTLMTLVVVLQITVMTKRILRAIELASKN